jgi:hypothetical protein
MRLLALHSSPANHYGVLLLIAGLFIRYQIGRRRFNRRTVAGVQIYSGYFKGILTVIIETLLNLLGAAIIVIGLIIVIVHL